MCWSIKSLRMAHGQWACVCIVLTKSFAFMRTSRGNRRQMCMCRSQQLNDLLWNARKHVSGKTMNSITWIKLMSCRRLRFSLKSHRCLQMSSNVQMMISLRLWHLMLTVRCLSSTLTGGSRCGMRCSADNVPMITGPSWQRCQRQTRLIQVPVAQAL